MPFQRHVHLLVLLGISLLLNACGSQNKDSSTSNKPSDITQTIFSSGCSDNHSIEYIYSSTQAEATHTIFSKINTLNSYPKIAVLKPYWDIRYTNPIEEHVNNTKALHLPNHAKHTGLDVRFGTSNILRGTSLSKVDTSSSIVQSKCQDGLIVAGTTLNLFDSPEQILTYAGVQSTFAYQFRYDNDIMPWANNATGNLMIQAFFDTPIYSKYDKNIGGSVSYNVFLHNEILEESLNFIITFYAMGEAWKDEKSDIRYDPTTHTTHIATVAKRNTKYATLSDISSELQTVKNTPNKITSDDGKWETLYRVNITHENLLNVLKKIEQNPPKEIGDNYFGTQPKDWKVTSISIQYELEEEGGKALLSGSFKGFESYISHHPL
ncbi:MAG: hypothetical protein U9N11_04745 [Campylobacterota bacterium]|nr:hypothetical protein [Campylobacterota bacterium]